ncbi:nicotinamidase [Asaia astilbis]|uniref:nicotinamidase n=1 Tax=Asaia astilbis TaxID=610244 RepID=UPI000470631E|nr:nicotinamidase [Asaia astilbis]
MASQRALSRHALIVIDIQNDFLPGGALAINEGDLILPTVNALLQQDFTAVIASRDWHPEHHISFTAQGGPWPVHCVAGTSGAAFAPGLDQRSLTHIIHKGTRESCDSYSAFFDNEQQASTGLDALLRGFYIEKVTLCGLALDVCVAATARDARSQGFETSIALNACKGIAADETPCLQELSELGIKLITS